MQELLKYVEFEPFFVTPSYPEDQFDLELFYLYEEPDPEDMVLISDLLK